MILVAENLTAARPPIARALVERDPSPILEVVELARQAGAAYLDVNLGAGARGRGDSLGFVLDVLGQNWKGGILLDTPDARVMAEAAAAWQGRGELVLNGFSGDPGREAVLDVAARTGASVVVFLMARGIPRTADERLALAAELAGRCGERGLGVERLWIDPVVAPLGWAAGQELDAELLLVLRRLPDLLGESVRSVVGLSNLTTASTGRRRARWVQEVFLAAAAGAGLTHAMVDVENEGVLRTARALEILQGRRLYAEADL